MKRSTGLFHRIDDVGEESYHDLEVLNCFAENGIPCIASVVPTQLSSSIANILTQMKDCSVFQHGFSHDNHVSIGYPDEFPVSYGIAQIRSDLLRGKVSLEDRLGQQIKGYTPPWNNTSPSTIVLLEELGFTHLSGHSRYEYFTSLKMVNVSIDLISSYQPLIMRPIEDVRRELQQRQYARKSRTGIVYHPKKFPDVCLGEIMSLIASLKTQTATDIGLNNTRH